MTRDINNAVVQATNLGLLIPSNVPNGRPFNDFHSDSINSGDDPVDFLKTRLDGVGNLTVFLTGLSTSATVILARNLNNDDFFDSGETIKQFDVSRNGGSFTVDGLDKGDYFFRILGDGSGNTNYSLVLSAVSGVGPEREPDTLLQPKNLEVLTGTRKMTGFIGPFINDIQDFYRFRLNTPTRFSAALTSSNGRVTDFDLFKTDNSIRFNASSSTSSLESLVVDRLPIGDYLIVPRTTAVSTNYGLTLTGTPLIHARSIANFSNSTPTTVGTNGSQTLIGQPRLSGIFDGKGGPDRIFTGDGDDIAIGGAGHDIINAGTGDDILFGGLGIDRETGGQGRDTFVLAPNTGVDVIKDFRNGIDKLGLANAIGFEMLEITQQRRDTVLGVGGERLAVLRNVRASQIGEEDFVAIDFTTFRGIKVPMVIA
jgi:Ca2+-binding RTX toxin-like protein